MFGAIVGAGGLIGLLLGGALTQYLDWRWCLYVNLVFAAVALPARWSCSRGRRSAAHRSVVVDARD